MRNPSNTVWKLPVMSGHWKKTIRSVSRLSQRVAMKSSTRTTIPIATPIWPRRCARRARSRPEELPRGRDDASLGSTTEHDRDAGEQRDRDAEPRDGKTEGRPDERVTSGRCFGLQLNRLRAAGSPGRRSGSPGRSGTRSSAARRSTVPSSIIAWSTVSNFFLNFEPFGITPPYLLAGLELSDDLERLAAVLARLREQDGRVDHGGVDLAGLERGEHLGRLRVLATAPWWASTSAITWSAVVPGLDAPLHGLRLRVGGDRDRVALRDHHALVAVEVRGPRSRRPSPGPR